MAKSHSGILGPVRGKVGNVVGTLHKGTNTLKQYGKTPSTQSQAQKDWRAFYGALAANCRLIFHTVIQPYWNELYPNTTGWNAIMKYNLRNITPPFSYPQFTVAYGLLLPALINSAIFIPASDKITISWDNSVYGNASPSDWSAVLVIDANLMQAYFEYGTERDEGTIDLSIGSNHNVADLHCYLFMSNGSEPFTTMSQSVYSAATL